MADHTSGGGGVKHDTDQRGELIHVDIDPFIPTGMCAICAGVEQETRAPEDRDN